MGKTIVWGFLLVALAASAAVWAGPDSSSSAFKTEVKRVAIFKDGYGYFSREGTATLEDGWASADFLPYASYGTVWAYVLEGKAEVSGLIATKTNLIPFDNPDQLSERLKDKIGLRLNVQHSDTQSEGELTHVLSDMILLKNAGQTLAVRLADVKSVTLMSYPLKIGTTAKSGTVKFGIDYLRAGISWAPTYILNITGEDTGELTLRSTITNGAEDLVNCDVFFVVGGANLTMKGQIDPLSQIALLTGMSAGKPDLYANVMREMAQAPGGARPEAAAEYDASGWEPSSVTGQGFAEMSEFFFYKKSGLTLRPGDVAMLNVFTKPVKYRSEFEWASGDAYVKRHLLVFNSTDAPFTTGPVLAIRDGKPLSQIEMKFTPVGAEDRAATFMASDVRCRAKEVEIARGTAQRFSGYDFIPIKMGGTITVNNNRPTDIEIVIHHSIVGNDLEIDDDGTIVSTKTQDLNSNAQVDWKVKVPAGKTIDLTYHMTRYVRANAQ